MKLLVAWFASGLIAALLALAIATTLFGNRGDDDASWTGGAAPLLAFGAGALPMALAHTVCFLWLRPRDVLPVRMARAGGAGLLAFGIGVSSLMWLAHHS